MNTGGRGIAIARSLIISNTAKADLDGIYDRIAADDPDAAAQYILRLDTYLHKIARIGRTGVPRDWLSPGLRAHIFGAYAIYFRVTGNDLTVVRTIHGARDIDTIIV